MKIFSYPGPFWRLYALIANLVLGLTVLFWSLACWFGQVLRLPDKIMTKIIRSWNATLLRIYNLKVSVSGRKFVDGDGAALILSNHQSLFDIPVIYRVTEGNLRMVAKAELFRIPFFGLALSSTGFIPVQREENANRRSASHAILDNLKKGYQIWVAPESTRNVDTKLKEFKSGSMGIAIQAQVPIVPIVIINAREALPKGSLFPRVGSVIKVHIMDPIDTSGMPVDRRHSLAIELREQMQKIISDHYAANPSNV